MTARNPLSGHVALVVAVMLVGAGLLPLLGSTRAVAAPNTVISGTIAEPGGLAVRGAEVFAFAVGQYPNAAGHATTGADGRYSITLPAGGTYQLAAAETTHAGGFYGSSSITGAGKITVSTGSAVTGKNITLAPLPRHTVTTAGVDLQPRSATRLLYKRSPRISGDRALWFDGEGVILRDHLSSGPAVESRISTEAYVGDLNDAYAFVGSKRIDLAAPSNVVTATSLTPEDVACDNGRVAFVSSDWNWTGPDDSAIETLTVLDANTLASVMTTTIARVKGSVSLSPGAVSGDRVVCVVDGSRVVVYDTKTRTKVRDFTPASEGEITAVLAGSRLAWSDGTTLKYKDLSSGAVTVTVTTVAAPRGLHSLRGGGGRVVVWEATDANTEMDNELGAFRANKLTVYDLGAGTSTTAYSQDATLTRAFDGMYDVSTDRTTWASDFPVVDAVFGLQSWEAAQVWAVQDGGVPARIDSDRYGLPSQWAPAISNGRVAWLDDSAHPGQYGTLGDLMLKPLGGSASTVTTLDTGLDNMFSSVPFALTSAFAVYAKPVPPDPAYPYDYRADLWAYDLAAKTKTRIATFDAGGSFGAWGTWVVYSVSDMDTGAQTLRAKDMRPGGVTRTIATTDWGLVFQVSNGRVLWTDGNGASWLHDLATGATRPFTLPEGAMSSPDGFGTSAIDFPHAVFDVDSGRWSGPGAEGFGFQFGTQTVANLETGEQFARNPFAVTPYTASLSGDFVIDGDKVYDIGTGLTHILPVPEGAGFGGACEGKTVVLQTWEGSGATLKVFDLSGEPGMMSRLAGPNRYATGVALSQDMTSAATVVIATGKDFPDALAGTPLAYAVHGPLLITDPASLSSSVASEVARLGATKAYILGGPSSVSPAVETQLKAQTHVTTIKRIDGGSRWGTAADIAVELKTLKGGGALPTAFLTTGKDFPDALSAAPIAARMGAPILLTEPKTMPTRTKSAFGKLGTTKTYVLGGESSVSAAVMGQAVSPVRVKGADRFDTAVQVTEKIGLANHVVDAHSFIFAVGNSFPDALGAASRAARVGLPLLLVDKKTPTALPGALVTFLSTRKAGVTTTPVVVGGEPTICLRLEQRIAGALR